jgi:hypothetical protein
MSSKGISDLGSLPRVEKSLRDYAPPLRLTAAIRKMTLSAAFVAVGFSGGFPAQPAGSAGAPSPPLKIVNRRERDWSAPFVLEVATPPFSPTINAFHRSHRSHSSHRSHASHYSSSSPSRPVTPPRPSTPPAAGDNQSSGSLEKDLLSTVVKVTAVNQEHHLIVGKDDEMKTQVFEFSNETKVRIMSPVEETVSIGALLALTGSLPFKKGEKILVHWRLRDGKGEATRITMLEK